MNDLNAFWVKADNAFVDVYMQQEKLIKKCLLPQCYIPFFYLLSLLALICHRDSMSLFHFLFHKETIEILTKSIELLFSEINFVDSSCQK